MDLNEIRNLSMNEISEIVKLYSSAKAMGESNVLTKLVESNPGNIKFGEVLDVLYNKNKIDEILSGADKYIPGLLTEMLRWQVCRNCRYVMYTRLRIHYHPFSYIYNNSLGRAELTKIFNENKDEFYIKALQRLTAEHMNIFLNLYPISSSDDNLKNNTFTDKIPYPIPECFTLESIDEFCRIRLTSFIHENKEHIPSITLLEALEDVPDDIKKKLSAYSHVYRNYMESHCKKNLEERMESLSDILLDEDVTD